MSVKTIVLSIALLVPLVTDAQQANIVSMAESGIRRVATKKPLPVYPAESLAKKSTGVAVALIVSSGEGRVASVAVLETPDNAIASAVREALLNWEIPATKVVGRSEPYGVRGKVTFYFQIVNGRGLVANPDDLPGGPKPEPPGGPPASSPGVRSGPRAVVSHDDQSAQEIGEQELARLLTATPRLTLLDIRERQDFERGHRDGAVNIPRDELAIRGWIEVDRGQPVVIDCARVETSSCQQAARLLAGGPKPVQVLILLP
jgi:rhodanese-related sulfurtransferase